MAAQGDALLQLPIFPLFQLPIQFRLARQNDLHHLAAPRFQISQQPDFFEHSPVQILRFIHDQNGRLVLVRPVNQHGVQREQHFRFGIAHALQVEIVRDHLEELLGRQSRIEKKGKRRMVSGEMVAQAFEHRRFACAHLAGQHDKTFTALHPVNEAREGFFVLSASIEKRRVGT